MIKKIYFCVFITLLPLCIYASELESLNSLPSQTTIDYFSVNMPNNESAMGLLGIHYGLNLLPIPDFYSGPGMYGAVTGNNGGFFAFGLDNDYRPQIYKSLYLDSGVFIGGGGARSAEVGGGFMLLPHLGLGYQLGNQRINLDYSYVDFPTGQISGSQIMLGVTFPSDFNFFAPSQDSGTNSTVDWQDDHLYLSPIIQVYHPKSGNTDLNGNLQDGNMGLMGAEGGKFITDRVYVALRATAIAKGDSGNGYMSVMGGLGYQYPLTQSFYWLNDIFAGPGGGGEVDTGNGIQFEADTGFGWQALPNLMPKATIGYLIAPDGHFKTWVGTIGFNYNLGWLSTPNNANNPNYYAPSDDIQHWRAEMFNQTLFNPQRTNSNSGNINLVGGSLEQQLTPNWYLSYRTSFAYSGDGTGGLATGMIGGGYQLNPQGCVHPHAEVLVGAAGGGGIDVGGGFLVEPEAGLRVDITRDFGLDLTGGWMKSTSGNLSSGVLNAGLVYSFGKLAQLP